MQGTRHYCDHCKESIYNVFIDGQRVPIVVYMVVSQPPDTGPAVALAKLRVPAFIREMMDLSTPRIELCVKCFAELTGHPLEKPLTDEQLQAMTVTHPKYGGQPVAPAVARVADLPAGTDQVTVDNIAKSDALFALKNKRHPTPAGRKRLTAAAEKRNARALKEARAAADKSAGAEPAAPTS